MSRRNLYVAYRGYDSECYCYSEPLFFFFLKDLYEFILKGSIGDNLFIKVIDMYQLKVNNIVSFLGINDGTFSRQFILKELKKELKKLKDKQ